MNDKILYSHKKAERSPYQFPLICLVPVVLFFIVHLISVWVDWFFIDEDFHIITIETIYQLFINPVSFGIYLFSFLGLKLIIKLIYDLFGTEIIYISGASLIINRKALFLHKTKVVKINNIVETFYDVRPKWLPNLTYDFQNDYKVKIKYYGKYQRLKRSFHCGMNFSAEEYVMFAKTLGSRNLSYV